MPKKLLFAAYSLPHEDQRYETCGDWRLADDGSIEILVSYMGDEKFVHLVAVHELVEVILCHYRGIGDVEVTAFDEAYEASRKEGDESEPGDDPKAPYAAEHSAATGVERLLASMLGVSWSQYDKAINAL